jgi:hypothetical protein
LSFIQNIVFFVNQFLTPVSVSYDALRKAYGITKLNDRFVDYVVHVVDQGLLFQKLLVQLFQQLIL